MTPSTLVGDYVVHADRHAIHDDSATSVDGLVTDPALQTLLRGLLTLDVYDEGVGRDLRDAGALAALPALRRLRTSLAAPVATVVAVLAELVAPFDDADGADWATLAEVVRHGPVGDQHLLDVLRASPDGEAWDDLARDLARDDPHAVYATSPYRWSDGHVLSSDDDTVVEAAMSQRTFTSLRVSEGTLGVDNHLLRDVWAPFGRCVAVVDANVDRHVGADLATYFDHHDITLDRLVLRAMEVDKGLGSVERLLGEFKRLGVSRREPVLVMGGGVLSDVAGLACALYHRNTPYVMLATSLVAGVDAGPSPRTCCDGFGYKNLLGAYHPPVLTITDRTFFTTMRDGWLRHGMAEVIKMAVVKDADLFAQLETAGPALVATRFGTTPGSDDLAAPSRRVLASALRSYVTAEYDNLWETHQARPHAYGHTWSPGFEISAGLLHGHAVSIGMALGATASHRAGWIDGDVRDRILDLIGWFGLSLWHDVLDNRDLLWEAQQRIIQKRGGRLVAPLPAGDVGHCAYLDDMDRAELDASIDALKVLVADRPRGGRGIEPLCRDVGLEDPSTVGGALVDDPTTDVLLTPGPATPTATSAATPAA